MRNHVTKLIVASGALMAATGCATFGEKEAQPLQQSQICMNNHAHVALSNEKYLAVIKVTDDDGKPIKCQPDAEKPKEVKKDEKQQK